MTTVIAWHKGFICISNTIIRKVGLIIRHYHARVPALLKCGGINNGFDRRTRLQRRQGRVELSVHYCTSIVEVCAAIHRQNLTRFSIHDDNGSIVNIVDLIKGTIPIAKVLLLRLIEMPLHSAFNIVFQVDVNSGTNIKTTIEECLDPQLAF